MRYEGKWRCAMRVNGGPGGNRTHIRGFAVRCITTLPPDLEGARPPYILGSVAPVKPHCVRMVHLSRRLGGAVELCLARPL